MENNTINNSTKSCITDLSIQELKKIIKTYTEKKNNIDHFIDNVSFVQEVCTKIVYMNLEHEGIHTESVLKQLLELANVKSIEEAVNIHYAAKNNID